MRPADLTPGPFPLREGVPRGQSACRTTFLSVLRGDFVPTPRCSGGLRNPPAPLPVVAMPRAPASTQETFRAASDAGRVTLSGHAVHGMLGRQDILFSSRTRCVSL